MNTGVRPEISDNKGLLFCLTLSLGLLPPHLTASSLVGTGFSEFLNVSMSSHRGASMGMFSLKMGIFLCFNFITALALHQCWLANDNDLAKIVNEM